MKVALAAMTAAVVALSGFRTAPPLAAEPLVSPPPESSIAVMDEFVQTVNWAAETYKTGPILVTTERLADENTFAMTTGRRIVFNSSYSNNPLKLFSAIQRNVTDGWFPGGCSPARTVALHEAAHVIDNTRGRLGSRRVAANWRRGNALQDEVSRYSFNKDGSLNAEEAVASAFQSVLCNGGTNAEMDMYYMLVQP